MKERHCGIIVAGGKGNRMGGDTPKQYLDLNGKTVLSYSLDAFEKSFVDRVIIVAAKEYIQYVIDEIVAPGEYTKVTDVLVGGNERYDSVYNGLLAAEGADYVYIHDAARPYLTLEMLEKAKSEVEAHQAMTFAMLVKETMKVSDQNQFAVETLDRSVIWGIQTPQVFSYKLIRDAYDEMMQDDHSGVTDDTMVAETYAGARVKLVEGSYKNIKITTPEDLVMMQAIMQSEQR